MRSSTLPRVLGALVLLLGSLALAEPATIKAGAPDAAGRQAIPLPTKGGVRFFDFGPAGVFMTSWAGTWFSKDAGQSWVLARDNQDDQITQLVRWKHTFVGTTFNGTLVQSATGTDPWKKLAPLSLGADNFVAALGQDDTTLYVATTAGTILRSQDGAKWTPGKLDGTGYQISSIQAGPKDVAALGQVSTGDDWESVLLRSSDHGKSWKEEQAFSDAVCGLSKNGEREVVAGAMHTWYRPRANMKWTASAETKEGRDVATSAGGVVRVDDLVTRDGGKTWFRVPPPAAGETLLELTLLQSKPPVLLFGTGDQTDRSKTRIFRAPAVAVPEGTQPKPLSKPAPESSETKF